jgi:branched-chain amino acid transport system ATP-binding protein
VVAERDAPSPSLLSVRDVSKRFGGLAAVDGVTFDVAERSITALIGPNGAGKSTLFNVVTGFERADRGQVLLDGRSVYRHSPHAIARRGMVRTFQLTKALSVMSVLDNMLLGNVHNPGERLGLAAVRPAWRKAEREARQRAWGLLEVFGLSAKAGDYAGTLSGGQRKLLELARALMLEPRLLLLDEPLAGVNRTLGRSLLEHIENLRVDRRLTILLVEHDMDVVMRHSDSVVVMAEGRVVAAGTPTQVRSDERVIAAYLGSVRIDQESPGG